MPLDGGFAGLFQLDFTSQLFARRYQDPVLVSCTDGVGTKLKVAIEAGVHDTVGIDLVAMSVNDAICCGAEPLFFLDYVAMSHDDPALLGADRLGRRRRLHRKRLRSARRRDGHLARPLSAAAITTWPVFASAWSSGGGSSTAARSRRAMLIMGVASSGLHSNGYSLVRKIVFEMAGLTVGDFVEPLGRTVGEALLEPTRIYVRPLRRVLQHYQVKSVVHGIAHITGGGLHENLERILPESTRGIVQRGSWPVPPVFAWLQQLGEVDQAEMDQVFNMGIGLVLVVSPFYADSIRSQLADFGLESWPIGRIESGQRGMAWG